MAVSKNAIEIYKQILNGLGAPITEENLKFLIAWQKAEGGKATNNPFNTTYNLDADVNKTKFNSHGVKNYTTPEYGITATIKTLKLPYYKNIVKGLQDNAGASNIASNIKELKTWGTGSLVAKVLGKDVSVNTLSSENVTPNRSLTDWAYTQEKNWSGVKEWDPKGVEILKEYNKRMGVTYNPSEHWSAITISNAVMADAGAKTKDEMRTLGFNPTKSHSGYVGDAFKTASDSDYKYNRYVAEKLDGEYKIGDILVKGRKDGKNVGTSKWSYEDFANSSKGYPSHGDIIVNKGQDSKGKYVILAGGNLSGTYKNSKLYLSDIDKKNYKVKLNDTKQGLFISEDGNLIDQPKLDNKTESVEDVLETNVAENETLENDIDETLETDVDETNIVSQRDYDLGFGNDFRLSDSAQMALFGTVLYPKNNSNSDFNNISYQDLQNTNQEEDFELLKPESKEEIDLDVDVDVAEDVEDIESTKNEKAWWTDDKENTKDITKKENDTPKSMRASYLEGDITTKEYQEYLKTTPKFKSDYDNLIKTSEKKLRDLKKVVNKEKYSRPAKGSFSYFKPEVTGYRNIYGYTDADFEIIKEPYIDFANKYGYDPKRLLTKKTADERRNAYSTGISLGEDFFDNTVIKKDLETYEKKYKEYNRLKDGFTKIGYDVDKDGNISRNGEIQPNTINDFIENEKNSYKKFDFSIGKYIPDESRASSLQLEINRENCKEKGLMWLPVHERCGTALEHHKELNYYDPGPATGYAGGDGGFFFNTIFGAANLVKLPLTYAGEMLWETAIDAGMEPVIEPIIDVPFDMYDGAFGTPDEQYNVRKKYLSPIINAKTRYDKADGFFNGVNAFFGGDPKYWKEGGSIELNLNKKEVLNYAKNGYIVEELPIAKDGGGTYKYNNTYYKKDSKGKWSKEINGRYYPLSKGDVAERSAILDKNAKKYYSNDIPTYSFKGRPEATYMKRGNLWFISTSPSGNKFDRINDPTGKRTKILNAQATLNNESKIQSEQNDKLVSAKEFQKKWMESPRYKEMLDESMKTQPYSAASMNSARKYNLISTPSIDLLPHNHKDADKIYGQSWSSDGQIDITPIGFPQEGTISHEVSHSIDRPFGNFYNGKRLIPKSDVNLVKKFTPKSFIESPKGNRYKKLSVKFNDEFLKEVNERMEYLTEPTETRARLNDIRNNSLNKNIYNPLKEKVTPEIYKKLEHGNPLNDLKEVYNDDQIIELLNTISDAGNNKTENVDLFMAKNGGEFIDLTDAEIQAYRNGGYIVEELPQDENGEQEPVGVSHLPPPSFYTYNNNQYAKRGTDWFKMINGNYHPLTAGNVPSRSKVLNKYAKLASKPEINESRIMDHLKLREGEDDKTYEDTEGYLTGGVGHKLTKAEIIKYPLHTTIPQPQRDKWLVQDIRKAIDAAKQQAEELQIYDPKFVEALTAVNFQLGPAWNTEHKNTWRFMKDGAFDKAAVEAADSDWYNQTPVRVKDFQKALKQVNATKLQDGGFIEIDLTEEAVNKYKDGGYVLEEIYDGAESGCPEGMASDGKGGCIEIASVFNEQEEFEKTLPKTEPKYYDKEGNLLETVPDYGTIYVTGKDDPKYKEYQDRLKFYNKAKKLHNDEGIKEWTRQVANRKDLYDSKKNNPTDWSADEISRSKKRYENLKGQKELYTDYRGDYKSERYTSQLPTVNWEDAKIASQKKSDWATYWDLGVKGSIQGTYGDYDHIPDAWSDLLSEALKTTVRPTKYFRGEGNMKPVFTYPSLNVKVLDEDILKEKSLSTPTTLKTQDPDEIYGEHSFRTGNRVVNGVLTPAEPESTSLPTKPLVKKSTPGTVVPPAMELKWFKSKAGTWYQDYVPTQGKEYNLNTGSYLQNGGESKCPEGYVFYNGQCVKWQEPKIIETDKNTGYNAATGEISQDTRPGSIENNGWWTEHEKYHHLQNLGGGMSTAGFLGQRPNNIVASDQAMGNYYNRRDTELEAQTDAMIKADPNLQFIPRNKLQGFTEGFPGANALMYQDPTTVEGEARVREKQFKKDAISMFPKKQNGGYIDVELNDNEVEQYKDKGYVVEMVDGGGVGDPPGSSNNPPNRNDSIAVMNNAIKQEEFYKNYEKDPDAFAYSIQKNDAGKNWLDWMQDARTEFLGHGSIDNRIRTEKGVHHVPFNEYYKNIDDNKFKQRDLANGILSLNAPMALYDKRIFPQSFNNLKDDKGVNILGDHVTLPKYEPLAVTPWDMLNDNQKQERLDKYGTSGTPFGSFVKPKGTLDSKESINVNLMKQGFATDNKSARAFKKKLWEEVYPDTPHKTKDNAAQNIKLNKWIFDNEDKLQGFKETGSLTEGREKIPEAPEPEFTPLPTRPLQTTPLVKKSTPGTIKPPQSTVKWVYNKKLGRWHEIQRAVKPEDLESRKIGFLQDGGEIRELTDEEVEQYKAGGYIIEEYPDGGITGGPEYDSRYGILGRFGYKNNFKGRDRSTQNTLSADIYGGRFGLGARGAYEFGSEKRGGFPAKNFMKTTIGRDNVRGFYGDVKGGSEIHAIKDRTNELNITPFGGFSIQSKAAGSAMPDADLLGSRVGLNYGIGANYKRKFKNDSNFNVYGSISGNPVLGKFTDKESYESENTNFAPQFNVGTRYTLPLNSNIRKINKKIKQKQKNLYPISNSSGSRASFTYEQ